MILISEGVTMSEGGVGLCALGLRIGTSVLLSILIYQLFSFSSNSLSSRIVVSLISISSYNALN